MTIFTKEFAIDAGERVVSTFFQGFVAALVITGFDVSNLQSAGQAALVGGVAAALSTLKAIAANLPSTTSTPAPAPQLTYAQYPVYEQAPADQLR